MRPITRAETELIHRALQPLVGAQLQACGQSDQEIGLGFYNRGGVEWLWFDFNPRHPFVARFVGSPPSKKKAAKPLSLFVRSHLVGRRLLAVECDPHVGRVLTLHFFSGPAGEKSGKPEAPYEFEARLFPHGQNAIARAAGKSVSLRPLHELLETQSTAEPEARSWEVLQAEWSNEREPLPAPGPAAAAASGPSPEQRTRQRAVEKKARAIEKMRVDIEAKQDTGFSRVGEWLKARGEIGAPSEWPEADVWQRCLRLDRSFSWNIENCFTKAKDGLRKIAGARARLAAVEAELTRLQHGRLTRSGGAAPSLLAKADARGRSLSLGPGLDAFIGRSARDNVALLRRAQAHDLWLHLRDFPSAHAIIRRPNKTAPVADAVVLRAALWLVEQTLKKSPRELSEQAFDVVIAERRFVNSIKGDKLGRVHYSNERTLRVKFP